MQGIKPCVIALWKEPRSAVAEHRALGTTPDTIGRFGPGLDVILTSSGWGISCLNQYLRDDYLSGATGLGPARPLSLLWVPYRFHFIFDSPRATLGLIWPLHVLSS